MAESMDEDLTKKDVFELINTFINRSLAKPAAQCARRGTRQQVSVEGLSFVITRSNSFSWAEDLAHLVSLEERTRLYN